MHTYNLHSYMYIRNILGCVFLGMMVWLSSPLYAAKQSQLRFKHLSVEDGLSHSKVYSIFQDSAGFLWFGTEDGLNRYDGYNLTVYKQDPRNPGSLSHNRILAIHEDSFGDVWIGTLGGLNKYERKTDSFTHYTVDPNDPFSISHNAIWTIYEDQHRTLWIGTLGGGLNQFLRESEQFLHYRHESGNASSLSDDAVLSIYADQTGRLWIGTANGLNRFDYQNRQFRHYLANPADPTSLSHNYISSLCEDLSGKLWIGTANGLNVFDPQTEQIRRYYTNPAQADSLSANAVSSLVQDRNGELWIGTLGGGINRFYPETDQFIRYQSLPHDSVSLSQNDVWTIYEDRSGVLWFGTLGGGVNVLNRKGEQFTYYQYDPNNSFSLSNNDVRAIYEDQAGQLWVGTLEGLNRLDPQTGDVTRYQANPQQPGSLSYNAVWSVYEDHEQNLWIGTLGGLNRFDRATETFTSYLPDSQNPFSISYHKIGPMYEDSSGALWIGTLGGGLNAFDRETEQFFHYQADPDDHRSLSHNVVSALYEDASGTLWVGTNGGLNRFDRDTRQFTRFLANPDDPYSLISNAILTLHEDRRGTLWIGTSNGLAAFRSDTGKFRHYRHKDGLPGEVIYGILEDANGNLWLSTNKGLSKFHPDTETFKNFDIRDGLRSNEFHIGASYRSPQTGMMYFGSVSGLLAFDSNRIKENQVLPPIVITDFQLFNRSVKPEADAPLQQPITETQTLELSYKDSVFSFEFAALDYTIPEKNQYAYMMEGFDRDWIYTTAQRRFATYTRLGGGRYVFRVKGANSDGLWNETGASLEILVTPPPWKTWWAYSLYVLTLAGAIIGYMHYMHTAHHREIERQRKELAQERLVTERLRQLDKMKDEFLANTSHELRTPLHGIIGIAESLLEGAAGDQPPLARQNLALIVSSGKRLTNLVNDILDFAKIKARSLEIQHKPVSLNVVADVVLAMSQVFLTGKTLTLNNQISEHLPPVRGDEDRLQQIFYNLIGNAIKFTETGTITLSARIISEPAELPQGHAAAQTLTFPLVAISVTDTGIGIPPEKHAAIFQSFEQIDGSSTRKYGGTGLGLAVTKQLVELHNGVIWVASTPGQGSTFTFTLPISDELPARVEASPFYLHPTVALPLQETAERNQETMPSSFSVQSEGEFTILIVDDEIINQQVLVNHLRSANYRVVQAMNGMEALQVLERGTRVDLILLDIMMPQMSGYEVARRVRKTFQASELQLPIIMLTAKNQVSDLVEGFSVGANDYLTKPISKQELLARIKTHLHLMNLNISYSRFVPFEFMKELGRESILDVKLGDQAHKEMTVMFSDIRSYTTLAEAMTPQDTFNFLNGYLGRIGPVIREHHGFVSQYYGDGIMAIFPKSAEDAVQAAIAMQQRVAEYNRLRQAKGRRPVKIGIGINTGSLMLGVIGDGQRTDTGIVADTVNTASRMEGLTKFYGASIVASESTFSKLPHPEQYQHRFLDRVMVKGKQQALSVFEIYAADSENIIALRKAAQQHFEQGQQQYFAGKFPEAIISFRNVLRVNLDDAAARLYFERALRLELEGVPEGWQGVETLTMK